MSSRLKKAIGAVKDQTSISLAKVASNNTSHLEVAVLKATTHDDLPIDERYVFEILQLVSSNKLYAAACARSLGKRISRTRNWIVALKSLMLVLRIFQDGDPYFPREILHAMKRGAKILNLSNFRDDSNSSPWDFTAFVRTFTLYLDERLDCFLTGKLQRRYTHRVREATKNRRANEPVREMKPSMLLDKISYWQRLLERAIATRPTGQAKHNRLVQICLYAVVQESFDLYKDVSDGLALLLDSFFHLQYQNCVSAFQTCVKASKLFEELGSFYSLCKTMGVGRTSEYPSVQTISEELMETLQEFLKDQSSFPATSKSPNRLMLPAPPHPNATSRSASYRSDSYGGQSDFSDRTSEYGSQCTSLEELISATEISGSNPSISIDLEDYSERLSRDKSYRLSDSGSTHSLPLTSSMADLVSLDDWPDEQGSKEQNHEPPQKQSKGWDLVLAEVIISTPPPVENHFNAFQEHEEEKQDVDQKQRESSGKDHQETENEQFQSSNSPKGWELVLAEMIRSQPSPVSHFNAFQKAEDVSPPDFETTGWELALVGDGSATTSQTQPQPQPQPSDHPITAAFDSSTMESLYSQCPNQTSSSQNYYNPFLQDAGSSSPSPLPLTNSAATANAAAAVDLQLGFPPDNGFSSATGEEAPTFQATPAPTFCAKNQKGSENDPFGDVCYNSSGPMNQQKFVHEQQLWLQNQNKIIAKHMT